MSSSPNKFLILIIILSLFNPFIYTSAQSKVPMNFKLRYITFRMMLYNSVVDDGVGNEIMRLAQYNRFLKLKKIATKEQLVELTSHKSAVVRCYAFWALCEDSSINIRPIYLKQLQYNSNVKNHFGCILTKGPAIDVMSSFLYSYKCALSQPYTDTTYCSWLDSVIHANPKYIHYRFR